MNTQQLRESLQQQGYALSPDLLAADKFASLHSLASDLEAASGRGGLRRLSERLPGLTEWLQKSGIDDIVKQLLSPTARRIRSLFFDKTPENNWKVPWHQDLTIAVQQRHELPDFGPWSVKEDIDHVQPPLWVLQRCLTVRIHLDDCPTDNGALRVRPGSHHQKGAAASGGDEVICAVPKGGVLLMSPLLFHASSKSQIQARRRVIHLEYCDAQLPQPLQWWET